MRTSTAAHWTPTAKPGPVVPGLASRSRVPRRLRRGRPGTLREGEAPTEAERLRYRNEAPRHLHGNHLRLCLRQGNCECDAMYFNAGRLKLPDPPWDIVFTIDRNTWKGRTSLAMSIQDIRPAQND